MFAVLVRAYPAFLLPWTMPILVACSVTGLALILYAHTKPSVRRVLVGLVLIVIGTAATVGPRFVSDICDWLPWMLECWLPY